MAVLVGPWFRESRPLWLASAVVTGVNWLENPVRWSCLLGMGLELDRADCFFAEGCRLGGAAKECVTPQLVARKHHGRGGSKDSGACTHSIIDTTPTASSPNDRQCRLNQIQRGSA